MNETQGHWSLRLDSARIAWLGIDCMDAAANTLGRAVMTELNERLEEVEQLRPAALILWSGKESGFVAGADITEFTRLRDSVEAYELVRLGQGVLERLESLPCPKAAAIHGFALGGGLELALACDYRVAASEGTRLGLPEVMLGIHPGFGGTVRAPRLIGAPAALDLMLTGRSIGPDRALQLGLVDRLAAREDLKAAARAIVLARPPRHRPAIGPRLLQLPLLRRLVAARARKQVLRRARSDHYPAPYAILALWESCGARGRDAYEAEARSIARLFITPTSRNLVRVFFLQNRLKALAGRPGRHFARVHIIGAGVMGGDIAAWCAWRGMEVSLHDREQRLVEMALERGREFLARRCRQPGLADACMRRMHADVAGDGIAAADLVIEAIHEDAEAKRALYSRIEPLLRPGTLLATNTSSIALERLAVGLADPGRLVGLHFFNPVAGMMLVEVVRGEATSESAASDAVAFTRQLDKLPLPCRSSPGFVVNRILMPYMTEAMFAAESGVPPAVIDRAAISFGMPMGPVELADTVGLDVALQVDRIMARAFGHAGPSGLQDMVTAGNLGRKSGRGFYEWRNGRPLKPEAASAPPEDLEDRLVLQLLNEAVACLREGIVGDADLLDAGMIFGTGFPPFRGGPIQYARERGIESTIARLLELERRYGPRFRPDDGWQTLVDLPQPGL
jgi:3-hydroxyacyl-CoA dehydrogenase/enoyl-CoA hydratase/3-hydroxybutyryl-CoA epimerase